MIALIAIFFVLSRIALPRIAAVLAERSGAITNDIAAAEDLKRQAQEAEAAYTKALADARAEAQAIAGKARDEIKAELDDAIAKADAEIAAKAAESEAAISAIREGALASAEEISKEIAGDVVSAMGGKVDAKAIAAAVDTRLKG